MGIEPTWSAWKAEALPLSYTRMVDGGWGRVRTYVDIRRQIYSLLPLTTRPPILSMKFCSIRSVKSTPKTLKSILWI
jgi:hypothetical protein